MTGDNCQHKFPLSRESGGLPYVKNFQTRKAIRISTVAILAARLLCLTIGSLWPQAVYAGDPIKIDVGYLPAGANQVLWVEVSVN